VIVSSAEFPDRPVHRAGLIEQLGGGYELRLIDDPADRRPRSAPTRPSRCSRT
jgi:hypothetical protein